MAYQLGLDTGGTYTDAALVDDDLKVVATAKSLTTHKDLIVGLRGAIEAIVDDDIAAVTPWYVDSRNMSDEDMYYIRSTKTSTMWTEQSNIVK